MSRALPSLVGLAYAVVALPASAAAQAVVSGTVLQDGTNKPLPGVEVVMEKRKRMVYTNESGRYSFADVPRGEHVILFRSVGFRPVRHMARVTGTDTVRTDAQLVAFGVTLEPIKVTAPPPVSSVGLAGFRERKELGLGVFIDSAELRRSESVRLADLMARGRGVQINKTREAAFAMSNSRVGPFGERCPLSLYVDGALLYQSVGIQLHTKGARSEPMQTPPDLNSFMGVSDLQAIEIYRRPSEVPMEFGGRNAACGVIVLWTRRAR